MAKINDLATKTNEIKYGFPKILPHRFANQHHRSIFAASFWRNMGKGRTRAQNGPFV